MLPSKHLTLLSRYKPDMASEEASADVSTGNTSGAMIDAWAAAPDSGPEYTTPTKAQAASMKPAPGKITRPITRWSHTHCM